MYHSRKKGSVHNFDQKLAEVDAYLQLLIEHSEKLDKKIELAGNEQERDGLIAVKNNSDNLLGSIKHAIVLLQIAKVTVKALPPNSPTSFVGNHLSSSPNSSSASTASPNAGSVIKPPSRKKDKFKDKRKQSNTSAANSDRSRLSTHSSSDLATSSNIVEASSNTNNKHQHRHPGASEALVDDSNTNSAVLGTSSSLSFRDQHGSSSSHNQTQQHDELQIVDASDDDEPFYDADDDTPATTPEADLQENFKNLTLNQTKFNASPSDIATSSNSNQISNCPNTKNAEISISIPPNNSNNNVDAKPSNPISTEQEKVISHPSIETNMEGSLDWESLYEEEEEDLGSLENHGSVIKHLMSQIRIGMDLTKVVLPTFILERRSLLEMYADFFAHPDLFSTIPDYETPEKRMIQLVRWYLSAFHAGRKSSVAKKPYNPILGEIFRCHWALKDDANVKNMNGCNEKGTIDTNLADTTDSYLGNQDCDIDKEFPRSLSKDSVIFVAEQVSHHPPVSAFYAENRAKRITCCAHIYTKSKYLGLSVGVNNIGQGTIRLLDHNETYTCTFPSAFGRSILTVPWVELGGPVNIKCIETQYSANIEFVTKPFYGGKKHRVLGEIIRPNNEPFMTIDGEWNGTMFSKSTATGDKEVFVDTGSLPVIRKHVRPVSTQETFESRNIWKEVTRALKFHDVVNATAAKTFIEQKQRESLKERQEKGVKWETKYFSPSDDGWIFTKPLETRHNLTNDQ